MPARCGCSSGGRALRRAASIVSLVGIRKLPGYVRSAYKLAEE